MPLEIKENVEDGVECDSKNLHIINDAKEYSIIEATELKIDGKSVKGSLQFAKNAQIHTHKGSLRCSHAKIENLDGGEVHATKVEISTASSGSIYAQDVIIDTVLDNLNIYASNKIEIKNLKGSNNTLKINYRDIPILNSKLDLINEDIDDLTQNLQNISKDRISYINILQKEIDELKIQREAIINSVNKASITIDGRSSKNNKIIFTIDEKTQLEFITQDKEYKKFFIRIDNNTIILEPTNIFIDLKSK